MKVQRQIDPKSYQSANGFIYHYQQLVKDVVIPYQYQVLNDQVDFVKLAEAMGAVGIRVTKKDEVAPAIEKAISLGRPVVLECVIDSDDKVFPMMSPGAPLEETFDADDLKK